MVTDTALQRLTAALRDAGVPVESVYERPSGTIRTATVSPGTLQPAAQPIIDRFDGSAQADAAYLDAQEPLLKDLRDQAVGAIAAIDTYLLLADTATAAQVRAEVKAIDQRQKKILQALVRLVERTWRST